MRYTKGERKKICFSFAQPWRTYRLQLQPFCQWNIVPRGKWREMTGVYSMMIFKQVLTYKRWLARTNFGSPCSIISWKNHINKQHNIRVQCNLYKLYFPQICIVYLSWSSLYTSWNFPKKAQSRKDLERRSFLLSHRSHKCQLKTIYRDRCRQHDFLTKNRMKGLGSDHNSVSKAQQNTTFAMHVAESKTFCGRSTCYISFGMPSMQHAW